MSKPFATPRLALALLTLALLTLALFTSASAFAQQVKPAAYPAGDLSGLQPGVSSDQDAIAVFGPTNAITTRSDTFPNTIHQAALTRWAEAPGPPPARPAA